MLNKLGVSEGRCPLLQSQASGFRELLGQGREAIMALCHLISHWPKQRMMFHEKENKFFCRVNESKERIPKTVKKALPKVLNKAHIKMSSLHH